jgi:hypothetical protein
MISLRKSGRAVFIFMTALAVMTALPHHAALAALVGTEAAAGPADGLGARGRLMRLLAGQEVRSALLAQGISPAEAEARIAGLTDAEVRRIADRIDGLPAAGNAFGAVILVLVIVLLTVLILKVTGHLR